MNTHKLIIQVLIVLITTSINNSNQSNPISSCDPNDPKFRCHNGGSCMEIELDNEFVRICQCRTGYTGRQCEQILTTTSVVCTNPDPCQPNGYCNAAASNSAAGYTCRCKPGYQGAHCESNINDCLNATCYNGGLCIDGVNSYECECPWPYFGRYCQIRMSCHSMPDLCKNNGICVDDDNGPICMCQTGFTGRDCSTQLDICSEQQCMHGSICRADSLVGYTCECKPGFTGRNCQYVDVCQLRRPCRNNSTCLSLIDSTDTDKIVYPQYTCECRPGYTGSHCEIKLATTTTRMSTTTTLVSTTTTTENSSIHQNGSFVLVVNLDPVEFGRRKSEIVAEFEKRFGILMLIKHEANSSNEMIYPYRPSAKPNESTWTKVHFIIMFACIYGQQQPNSPCLQNNVDNLNDVFGILSELKKASMPDYVTNISYEAYESSRGPIDKSTQSSHGSGGVTFTLAISVLVLFVVSGFLMGMIVRQQMVKRVRAPVWYPPVGDNPYTEAPMIEMDKGMMKKMTSPSMNGQAKMNTTPSWSISKTFDDFTSLFTSKTQHNHHKYTNNSDSSPPSSDSGRAESEYGEYSEVCKPPNKMRRIGGECEPNVYTRQGLPSSSSFLTPLPPLINHESNVNRSVSPEFYPSPPESLPELLTPANYKAANYGITPLMAYVMSRKMTLSAAAVDKYIQSGADMNAQNEDGDTALHISCRNGHADVAERLIKLGADLFVYNNSGLLAFHVAVCANQRQIVRMMLDFCKAMCDAHDQQQQQQLQHIQQQQQQGFAPTNGNNQVLTDSGYNIIDLKAECVIGDTALMMAVRNHVYDHDYTDMIQLLIQYKANVNAVDNEGQSALHHCAKVNNYEIASLLIFNGAQVGLQDNNDQTPLSVALSAYGTLETAELLMQNEAYMTNDDHMALEKKKSGLEAAHMTFANNNNPKKQQHVDITNTTSNGLKRKLSDVVGSQLSSYESKPVKISGKKSVKSEKSKKVAKQCSEYKESGLNVDYPSSYYKNGFTASTNETSKLNQLLTQYDYSSYTSVQQSTSKYSPPPTYSSQPPKYAQYENVFNGTAKIEPTGAINYSYLNDKNGYEYSNSMYNQQYYQSDKVAASQHVNKPAASISPVFMNPAACFNSNSGSTDTYAAYF